MIEEKRPAITKVPFMARFAVTLPKDGPGGTGSTTYSAVVKETGDEK
jgi:hypothetical protein